jgi:eukaryotic-like serine/threonine-protein kinase
MHGPEAYQRAKSLFLVASRLPRGERTRFLSTQCAGDDALESQVRRLLTSEERDPEFLESPALGAGTPALGVGDLLGHFRIVRLLGEGGMGVVYEAQQEEPSRRVALKLVRPGFFSARLRSRFRHEIRILGQLRHPGIAQIYEAGTLELAGEQVPYFAMELVEGRPLLEAARERRLGTRERLLLMAQVCDAVHHAHQKGVIHRDLKPGNILVEEAPTSDQTGDSLAAMPLQVKVLDFGVARAVDTQTPAPSLNTQAGQLIGTLPYMSPEQAAGDPGAMDIRSDVYSIGVIAYELLAHRLPYELEGRSLAAAAVTIRETEPALLGAHDRALRGDAETIVAKALQKEAGQRFQSAADFGADIRRFLRDEPIVARPSSALYKLRKFARRHRAGVAAALLVFLAMMGATAVSTWQADVAMKARKFAEGEQDRADAEAGVARRQARRATLAASAAAIESGDPIAAAAVPGGHGGAQSRLGLALLALASGPERGEAGAGRADRGFVAERRRRGGRAGASGRLGTAGLALGGWPSDGGSIGARPGEAGGADRRRQ